MTLRAVVGVAALLTAGVFAVAAIDAIPLGLPGEWVWNRTPGWPPLSRWILPGLATVGYASLLTFIVAIAQRAGRMGPWLFLPILFAAGWLIQFAWLDLPATPLGIERWPTSIVMPAASGYFEVARHQRTPAFLTDYEAWIAHADSFHIGTHPPGLFVGHRFLLDWFEWHPASARLVLTALPDRFRLGMSIVVDGGKSSPRSGAPALSIAEQATVGASAIITWIVSLLTILPIYFLVRLFADRPASLLAAGMWPLIPASPLFLPTADCLYPFLAASIVALFCFANSRPSVLCGLVAGFAWWTGAMTSLAFVAVLPIALGAPILAWLLSGNDGHGIPSRRLLWSLGAFLSGVAAPIGFMRYAYGLNLFAVWRINLEKHAGFYDAMPRSYVAWIAIDLLEFAIVLGPAVVAALGAAAISLIGNRTSRIRNDRSNLNGVECNRLQWGESLLLCFILTLLALDISGRNRSEVARLWIFLMPFACVAFGMLEDRLHVRWRSQILLVILQAIAGLALIARIEPLLPFSVAV